MSWFLSVAGQRCATIGGMLCSLGSFSIYYLPNSVFLNSFKETTHFYCAGQPVGLSPSVQVLCNEVKKDLKLSTEQDEETIFYPCGGFNFFKKGCLYDTSPLKAFNGAVIGIPTNLGWKPNEDLAAKKIIFNQEPVKWSEPSGQNLRESLYLSDNAKKFAIAFNVCQTILPGPLVFGGMASFFTSATFVYSRALNRQFDFYKQTRSKRFILYGLVALFNGLMFLFMKDFATIYGETRADDMVAELGIDYINGGEEYITKVMERNRAFREILGPQGDKYFTATGNEKVLIRQMNQQLSARLDVFRRLKKEHLEKSEEQKKV